MKHIYFYLFFFSALLISQPLIADEVWNSTYGKVVYESEMGTTAVWSYNYQSKPGLIYIDNLAGVYQGRDSYQGYWVQTFSDVKCKTKKRMKGKLSAYWGQFQIQFLDPDFPARWEAKWSYCDQEPLKIWQGTPL
jgi:nitrate reductase beta subunit